VGFQEVGEKGLNLRQVHLGRTVHVMGVDVAFGPADVGLLGAPEQCYGPMASRTWSSSYWEPVPLVSGGRI
jgi:hypothetical protein